MVNALCIAAVPATSALTAESAAGAQSAGRAKRVIAMMVCVAAVSFADLAMTLTYATTVGMMEVNPIARYIMSADTPVFIILWKLMTVGLCIGVLTTLRHRKSAERASWICLLGMLALAAHWVNFNNQVQHATPELSTLAGNDSPYWVHMRSDVQLAQY